MSAPLNKAVIKNALCYRLAKQDNRILGLFLATPVNPELVEKAKTICSECPVRIQCLLSAGHSETNIVGGLEPFERKLLRWRRIESVEESNWRHIAEVIQ